MKRPFPPAPAASDAKKNSFEKRALLSFYRKKPFFPIREKARAKALFLHPGILLFEKERGKSIA